MLDVRILTNPAPTPIAEVASVLSKPEFGAVFGDHMVTMEYRDGAWGPLELKPFAPLELSPATLALHYGQSIFEALKAYSMADGTAALFRPDRNAARMSASARRIAMPELPDGAFSLACALVAGADRRWIPSVDGSALYLRPFMFASEPHLSVRPATEYLFVVIASPVASYFGESSSAINVLVEANDVRATPGGTGAAKFAGNYAAGFAAHGRSAVAGCDQVLWLDSTEHRWIEELNAMNVMFVWDRDDKVVLTTPPLTGTILEGVTRASLLDLARGSNHEGRPLSVHEEPTSIDQAISGVRDGSLREVFACGTAAVVAPIGRLAYEGVETVVGDASPGPVTVELRRRLLAIQQGSAPDPSGWMVDIDSVLSKAGLMF